LELRALGYEPEDIHWSLGYVQGDGVTFDFGGDISALAERLLVKNQPYHERMAEQLQDLPTKAERLCAVGAQIVPVESGHTIYIETETNDEGALVDEFRDALMEDVREQCRRLQDDGYRILEATSPFWFAGGEQHYEGDTVVACIRKYYTKTQCVRVELLDDEDWDGYESGEEEADHNTLKHMVAGDTVMYALRVRIMEWDPDTEEEGEELASSTAWGILDGRDLQYTRELRKDVLQDARAEL
jgi:hypothetical protein